MDTQTLQNKKTIISEPDITNWKVLKIGSGLTHGSITFAQRKAHVTAIDFSHIALTLSQKFCRELEFSVMPIRADAKTPPFKIGSFDLDFNAGVHVHPAFNYLLSSFLPKHHCIEPIMRRFKSIIGQDYVVWGNVPETQPTPKGSPAQ